MKNVTLSFTAAHTLQVEFTAIVCLQHSLSYKLRCPPAMCSMTDAWQGHHKAMIQIMATQASGADVFVRGATDTMSKILQKKKLICHEALMAAYSSFSQTIFEEG